MGFDLHLRAFPEQCELWVKARADRQIAENMQFLGDFESEPDNEADRYFLEAVQQLVREYPGLLERYY